MMSLFTRFMLISTLFSAHFFLSSCHSAPNPLNLQGKTLSAIQEITGDKGTIIYVRRGVTDPRTYSGYILLSPYVIRHPANSSGVTSEFWCRVEAGKIQTCTGLHIPTPRPRLLDWFPGKQLTEIPAEFYLQSAGSDSHDWKRVETFSGDLEDFSGLVAFFVQGATYYAEFWKGKCSAVRVEWK